jgi:DNA-3-methyladenine glycosylase II
MANEYPFSVEAALAHLRKADPVLGGVIERSGPYRMGLRSDPYASLLRTILFQQLAGPAAQAIQRRFIALYGNSEAPPTPEQLAATTDEQFRSTGVSRQKAGYMRDLALHVLDGRLAFEELPALTDDEIIKRLISVRGIGEWSAHMFLMFHLGRPDVLPVGDLGVRHGMRIAYGLAEPPSPARAKEIGEPWTPFRSVGSWYMWRVVEAAPPDL